MIQRLRQYFVGPAADPAVPPEVAPEEPRRSLISLIIASSYVVYNLALVASVALYAMDGGEWRDEASAIVVAVVGLHILFGALSVIFAEGGRIADALAARYPWSERRFEAAVLMFNDAVIMPIALLAGALPLVDDHKDDEQRRALAYGVAITAAFVGNLLCLIKNAYA